MRQNRRRLQLQLRLFLDSVFTLSFGSAVFLLAAAVSSSKILTTTTPGAAHWPLENPTTAQSSRGRTATSGWGRTWWAMGTTPRS